MQSEGSTDAAAAKSVGGPGLASSSAQAGAAAGGSVRTQNVAAGGGSATARRGVAGAGNAAPAGAAGEGDVSLSGAGGGGSSARAGSAGHGDVPDAGADAAHAAAAGSGETAQSGSAGAGAQSEAQPDADGCPLNLEGFAGLADGAQNGTSGGSGGETVSVDNQADLERYAKSDEPYVIRVRGALKISPKGTEVRLKSNKTVIGAGADAEIVEGGFFLDEGTHNVIIRNLTIHGSFVEDDWEGKTQDFDGVQMDSAHHVWIDHCHFHHMGDGLIDSRKDTTFLTVSWNILSDHNKAFGIGWTDNISAQITIHHNWLRDTNQRNPSTDNVLRAHLYNNWLQHIASYGNYARGGTNMVLENSVFEDVKDPHFYDTGSLIAIDNAYTNTNGKRTQSGSSYDLFDPHTFYAYSLTPRADVPKLLSKCAGPRSSLGQ